MKINVRSMNAMKRLIVIIIALILAISIMEGIKSFAGGRFIVSYRMEWRIAWI